MTFRNVVVGEIAELQRRRVEVELLQTYTEIGIRSFGRGVFHKEPIQGIELGNKRVFEIRPGDLVLNNVFAWEGAVAIASDTEEGMIGSHRFMTYVVNADRADAGYIRYFLTSERGLELLGTASPGSAGRNRTLSIRAFEALPLDLPDVTEQRRIATKIDSFVECVRALERLVSKVDVSSAATLYPSLAEEVFEQRSSETVSVVDLATIISDVVHPGDDPGPAKTFVGLQHIESHTGRRTGELPVGGETGRKFRFRPGDVLYGYLRPYLNKVWVADRHGLCSVDQYVLRPKPGVNAGLLAHALRSQAFLDRAIDLTHNLQLPRLRSGLLLDLEIPVLEPSTSRTTELELDQALDRVLRLVHLRNTQSPKLKALIPSVLNHAFNGQL